MAKIYRKNDIGIVKRLISKAEESIKNAERNIQHLTGDELFEALLEDQKELKKVLHDKESMAVIMVGIYAAFWINKKMEKWLGEKSAADTLSQSVPNNVTSEMGLALLDVSDVARKYPEVLDYFKQPNDETFLKTLKSWKAGPPSERLCGNFSINTACAAQVRST